jgi:hypothetical protein
MALERFSQMGVVVVVVIVVGDQKIVRKRMIL